MKKAHERQQEDRAQTAARSSKDIEAAQAGSAFRCASRHLALDERQESDRPPVPAASPEPDLFELGLVQDEEDFYYVKLVLEKLRSGEELNEADLPDPREDIDGNDQELDTGSAKTQGFFKIPARDKAKHMPDRNKAIIDTSAAAALASARDNRADSRRFVANLEQHKRESASDTDVLKFNQLRTRKKQLKFAKSPIHDWGLYAMEVIPKGDMVIEYVGEIIRQQVADEREKAQELAGIFSTYLFRVDDDTVVDATHKGNIARLMNHCCTPNCTAKILTLNGEKKIVIYAKEPILPGQELTYDYKSSAGDEDAIPCLCGSSGCRRFL
ncbi:SET domain-containing protein [Tilletiaria anomala UBC 951]|uniref:Histone-lysine N-methyltransferase, H3 lysine-4 specific n=1 Tax=Tilletiaria anomala (strain ATCC 24038 / CBS 436.72 / UBC 951) TaxID=1037660 RepID=A0A066WI88_TILAU|nr:SET domain-containing protein [Tilletiaria anomala UBC 951]KDN53551.1 SET domain-containing protein [Tilletiaria anomala UBC 951]